MLEVAFDRYVAVRGSVPRNVLHVKRGEQEGIESDILQTDLAAERIRISQAKRIAARQTAIGHRGVKFKFSDAAIGVQVAVEAADNFLSHAKIHDADAAVSCGRVVRSGGLDAECQLAKDRETLGLNFLYVVERQRSADEIGGNIFAGELIA